MDGGRHGRQTYTVSLPRETPITGLCWEYDTFHRPDEVMGILKAKVCQEFKLDFDISKEDFISNYWNMLEKGEMWDHPMNGLYLDMVAMYQDKCTPHSLTLEECVRVQEVYIEAMERYKGANPEYTYDPDRHEGLDLAISIMQGSKQPTRLVYCYTY